MKLKKLLAVALAATLLLATTACSTPKEEQKPQEDQALPGVSAPISMATLNGPTGVGLAPLMDDANFNVTVYQSPDEITGKIVTGEVDIAAIPSNLASVLYNKTGGQIKVISTITMGVLYIFTGDSAFTDFAALDGKTVYASGKGGVPEYVMEKLMSEYGIHINLEWLGTHGDVVAKVKAALDSGNSDVIALIPEPQVSILKSSADVSCSTLDINQTWKDVTGEELPMGVLVAQKKFVDERSEDLEAFLQIAKASVDKVNAAPELYGSAETEKQAEGQATLELLVEKGFFKDSSTASQAIPGCNIVMFTDHSYQAGLDNLYNILFEMNPKSVGGKLAGKELYYEKTDN